MYIHQNAYNNIPIPKEVKEIIKTTNEKLFVIKFIIDFNVSNIWITM